MRRDGKWSVQEHIGHLLDLEPLFLGRSKDFEVGAEILRPADMTNKRTYEANYNLKQVEKILSVFRQERGKLIRRLDDYPAEMFSRTALHPRLNKPMRLIDSLYFQAEHDDHHLTLILHSWERMISSTRQSDKIGKKEKSRDGSSEQSKKG